MKIQRDIGKYCFDGSRDFTIDAEATRVENYYKDKADYRQQLADYRDEANALQNMMYAHDRHGMLLIFQAMDAAGKDSTIQRVMSGINPHGVFVTSFQRPSKIELDRSFLWRSNVQMPARGRIHIFNRSYYEEVLVTKVHPEIVTSIQRLPEANTLDMEKLWQQRYEDILNMELYESHNGIHIVKFFLHISKQEQRRRLIARIDRPEKNWKFSEADVDERRHWDDYQLAYEEAINRTASPHAPWYVIPADDKKNMRLLVANIVLKHLRELDMCYPVVDERRKAELQHIRYELETES